MCLGIPGKIVEISNPRDSLAVVDVCGIRREVNIACIVEPSHGVADCLGDWVLIHAGFAMSRIDAGEARLTLEILQQLDDARAEIAAMEAAPEAAPDRRAADDDDRPA